MSWIDRKTVPYKQIKKALTITLIYLDYNVESLGSSGRLEKAKEGSGRLGKQEGSGRFGQVREGLGRLGRAREDFGRLGAPREASGERRKRGLGKAWEGLWGAEL